MATLYKQQGPTRFTFNKKSGLHYGIGSNHDFAGCIVKDGKILCAIEAERINKIKHSVGAFNPFNSVTKYLFPENEAIITRIACCDTLNSSFYNQFGSHVRVYNVGRYSRF
ncbi:MAG: hypothetical protein Q8R36_00865 [bacterium]|nr:hypothetical protein [bacterium]